MVWIFHEDNVKDASQAFSEGSTNAKGGGGNINGGGGSSNSGSKGGGERNSGGEEGSGGSGFDAGRGGDAGGGVCVGRMVWGTALKPLYRDSFVLLRRALYLVIQSAIRRHPLYPTVPAPELQVGQLCHQTYHSHCYCPATVTYMSPVP